MRVNTVRESSAHWIDLSFVKLVGAAELSGIDSGKSCTSCSRRGLNHALHEREPARILIASLARWNVPRLCSASMWLLASGTVSRCTAALSAASAVAGCISR